uniref:FXYD domain-containing ion transport regulator n=1 Tax=Hippocampus comes TaxID=109280 RepID=A0A3Q2Y095_HIPCM
LATQKMDPPYHNDFEYDEETLRTTGLVLAIVMFVAGILIALSTFLLLLYLHCSTLTGLFIRSTRRVY